MLNGFQYILSNKNLEKQIMRLDEVLIHFFNTLSFKICPQFIKNLFLLLLNSNSDASFISKIVSQKQATISFSDCISKNITHPYLLFEII